MVGTWKVLNRSSPPIVRGCWFCGNPLEGYSARFYVCKSCVKKYDLVNIEHFLVTKQDEEFYESIRRQDSRFG